MGFEAGDEGFFFGDLVLGFFDEVGGGFVDIIWVGHAEVERVELAADREDLLGEGILVIFDYLLGDIKIELVIRES